MVPGSGSLRGMRRAARMRRAGLTPFPENAMPQQTESPDGGRAQ